MRRRAASGISFTCPICDGGDAVDRFRRSTARTPINDADFRPSSSDFGTTLAEPVTCRDCGHGSLATRPAAGDLAVTYAHVDDGETTTELAGRALTAERDLRRLSRLTGVAGGPLVDIGCWTGDLVEAAAQLGWEASGLEPSEWAVDRAADRGRNVRQGELGDGDGLQNDHYAAVTCCDVLEHLLDPRAAAARIVEILAPGGVLFATVPDAGSVPARVLGSRWWSVMPMHVQYFTRSSLVRMLTGAGLEIVDVSSHSKVFSRRYYGDRFAEFLPVLGPSLARLIALIPGAERPVAPDLHDRISVIARRPADPQTSTSKVCGT